MPKGRQMPESGNPTAALAQQCPMPNAQCPMPNAQCPMPNLQVSQSRENLTTKDEKDILHSCHATCFNRGNQGRFSGSSATCPAFFKLNVNPWSCNERIFVVKNHRKL
ncbi:MAG: hypothetical protein ACHBN1_24535 [Heteroscytonema crispum UTEX LB 1556]